MRILRAQSAIELALWQEALSDIGYLIAARPHEAQFRNLLASCWLRIGNAHRVAGQTEAAIAAYRNAAQSAPKQVEAYAHLGDLLTAAGKPRDALQWLVAVTRERPDDAGAALKLAEAELDSGEIQNAARRLLDWQSRLGSDATARKAAELLLRARCDDAATALAARIAKTGTDAWAWCWYFAVHMRAKSDLSASRAVLTALRDAQSDPALRMRAELGLALGLPYTYASTDELRSVRAQFERNLAGFIERISGGENRAHRAGARPTVLGQFPARLSRRKRPRAADTVRAMAVAIPHRAAARLRRQRRHHPLARVPAWRWFRATFTSARSAGISRRGWKRWRATGS